jgi:tetratricopeptide (TPR) repeat protein
MNCPVCQQTLIELIEKPLLSEEDELLISNLPYVIAYPLKRTLLEKHPWTKINLLKDTFLNYLKYIGLITASDFFNSPLKDKKMVALFQQALAEPSFGSWNQYIRETLSYLKENNHSFFCSDLLSYYDLIESGKKRKLFKGEIEIMDANGDIQIKKQEATAIGMLINFRNRYLGHGLTLDESDAVKHWEMYFPIFRELLVQLKFPVVYPMFKCEHGETYLLKSAEISLVEKGNQTSSRVWIENPEGNSMDILPFFVVPGEVSIGKEDKEQLLTYESYTGKTIKFFSPEGTEKQTSGKILEKLNLLLRDKQKETPFSPEAFSKDEFLKRIAEENKLLLDTLISEKKIIPGIYQHREEMEIKLREWIGARASIFFIVAEAGSGKTNLLVEMQRQYTERQLPSLLIRAGRMEKQSLKEQISYLLNISLEEGLTNYSSIAGTQAEPTFILIDGLNEANNAEEIWREIIDISKVFIPGSIKFVVTNRANTKAELSRYIVSENDFNLLYGENKDNETELGAYSFWLTALDMKEMKGAWEKYNHKDKYKPLFSFDDLATFDRVLYNHLSNPLVLRLFLETYHSKLLPKKGNKHLNIWEDWLATFSDAELEFLESITYEIWNQGKNELLLDNLLKNKIFKDLLTIDLVSSPYPRLKNKGWISRYIKDLNVYISMTVEGALFHLLGKHLLFIKKVSTVNEIIEILQEGNKLKKASIEVFLSQKAIIGDLSLTSELIDLGEEYYTLCFKPVLNFIKTFDGQITIQKLMEEPTNNDWHFLWKLISTLEELQEFEKVKNILHELKKINTLKSKQEILIALKTLNDLFGSDEIQYRKEIDSIFIMNHDDHEILNEIAKIEIKQSNNKSALYYLKKCYEIRVSQLNTSKDLVAKVCSNIGVVYSNLKDFDEAIIWKEKALKLNKELFGENSIDVAFVMNGIGVIYKRKGDFILAIECFEESYRIYSKLQGDFTFNIAMICHNIGSIYYNLKEKDRAKDYFFKGLFIARKLFDSHDLRLVRFIKTYSSCLYTFGFYKEALIHYQELIEIDKQNNELEQLLFYYDRIGNCCVYLNDFVNAIDNYILALNVKKDGEVFLKLGESQEKLGLMIESLLSYIESAEFRKDNLEGGIENMKSIESAKNVVRLAKEINQLKNIPNWIKELKLG